jgi:sugar phosphate isomerase/epimerase
MDHLTMLDVSPPDMVSTAREAGFDSVGLRVSPASPGEDPWPMLGGSPMLEETLRRLADTGVRVLDIELVRLVAGTRPDDHEPTLEAGARLGARFVTVNGYDPEIDRASDAFAGLVELARPYDVRPVLEPIPYSNVGTLQEAVRIAEGSGGGGVLLDPLHFQRYGGELDALRSLPERLLSYVQVCDAPLAAPNGLPRPPSLPRGQSTGGSDLELESRAMRMLPGDGELPLPDFLAALPAHLPLSVEAPVFSLRQRLSPVQFARRAREAVAGLAPAARSAGGGGVR